ncbi:hypothetical protein R3P38DRAFT_3177209 [Favolaschia claudopus]|uniref:Uncharacterized protein n=1 Tax=Favolaschia claudopus TaxID=2862362 RepID=A0AAW0D0X4_9AGAR
MVSLTPSIYFHIGLFCEMPERISLYQVSRRICGVMRTMFYRNIEVEGNAATLVVRSLAENPELPKFVERLWFTDRDVLMEGEPWAIALPAMKNLWLLIIAGTINIPREVIPHIPFQLRFFGSGSNMSGNWAEFLLHQFALEELVINGDAFDLAQMVPLHRHLTDIWFCTGRKALAERSLEQAHADLFTRARAHLTGLRIGVPKLLPILSAAPGMLRFLQDLVLDEDLSWSAFTLNDDHEDVLYLWESPLRVLAEALDVRFSELETVFLVFHPSLRTRVGNNRRLLSVLDARCFATVFASYSTAPLIQNLRNQAKDGYAVCEDWKVVDIKYFDLEDKPLVQTPRYAHLFTHEDKYF